MQYGHTHTQGTTKGNICRDAQKSTEWEVKWEAAEQNEN